MERRFFFSFRSNFIAIALGNVISLTLPPSLSLCFVAFRDVTTSLKHTNFVTAQQPRFPSQHRAVLGRRFCVPVCPVGLLLYFGGWNWTQQARSETLLQ